MTFLTVLALLLPGISFLGWVVWMVIVHREEVFTSPGGVAAAAVVGTLCAHCGQTLTDGICTHCSQPQPTTAPASN